MHMAVDNAPRDRPLTILTDSMNVIYALAAYNTCEFARDIRCQLNADILCDILLAINMQEALMTIMKVKSHSGVYLNDQADELAGAARTAADDSVGTRYHGFQPQNLGLLFTWVEQEGAEPTVTTDMKLVTKRWGKQAGARQVEQARRAGTYAGSFLTDPDAG